MPPALTRLVIYTHQTDAMVAFYSRHFGYAAQTDPADRIVELIPPGAGAILMLHLAANGQKAGQAPVKLVFDVLDVADFVAKAAASGLDFGPVHQADGYAFANAKDPAGNSVSVSSRGYRHT